MEEILSVYFITEENIAELKRDNENDILPSVPGVAIEFEVGKVMVVQTIKATDLFEETFHTTRHNVWLATREQFDAKFNIDEEVETEYFALISRK